MTLAERIEENGRHINYTLQLISKVAIDRSYDGLHSCNISSKYTYLVETYQPLSYINNHDLKERNVTEEISSDDSNSSFIICSPRQFDSNKAKRNISRSSIYANNDTSDETSPLTSKEAANENKYSFSCPCPMQFISLALQNMEQIRRNITDR